MALADCGLIEIIPSINHTLANISHVTKALDGSGEGIAGVWTASDDTQAIDRVYINVEAVNGTPPTYAVAIETVTNTPTQGIPSGTDAGGGSPTSVDVTPGTWGTGSNEITLTNPFTPTVGVAYAVTVRHSSGTVNAGACIDVYARQNEMATYRATPSLALLAATVWSSEARRPVIAPIYEDNSIPLGFLPITNMENDPWNTGDAPPLWKANSFVLPVAHRVCGISLGARLYAAADVRVAIFNGAVEEVGMDITADMGWGTTAAGNPVHISLPLTVLAANTTYHAAVKPLAASDINYFYKWSFADLAKKRAVFGGNVSGSTSPATVSWNDANTVIYSISPVIDQIDGAGGVFPGFGGAGIV